MSVCVQLVRAGRSAFVYLFNNVASDAFLKLIGPGHTMDLPFIFNDLPTFLQTIKSKFLPEEKPTFTATEQALAEQVAQYWLNFARHLDPSPVQSSLPHWLPTTGESPAWMEFTNDKPVPRAQPYYHSRQVKFWLKTYHERVANVCAVNTEAGRVLGKAEHGVKRWLGVPYAADPVGELRWRSPRPAEAWSGVMTADTSPLCGKCVVGYLFGCCIG